MPWSRQFSAPITLKDGRMIATLGQAREMMLSLSPVRRRCDVWRHAADLLNEAAADHSYVPHAEAEALFLRALKAEGLL
jgi:hypothetical protein